MRMELIHRGECVRSDDCLRGFDELINLKDFWDLEWTRGDDTIVNIYGDDGGLIKSCTLAHVIKEWRPWMSDDERGLSKKPDKPARRKPIFDPDDLSPEWIFAGLLLTALMVMSMWLFGNFDQQAIASGFIKRPDGTVDRINVYNYRTWRDGTIYLETDKGTFETGVNNVWLER